MTEAPPPAGGRSTALITGGTRGIGLGVARALAREGWNLALCGMRAEADVGPILQELRQSGAMVCYDVVAIWSREARTRFIQALRPRLGSVHALVNNAGMAPRLSAAILDCREE